MTFVDENCNLFFFFCNLITNDLGLVQYFKVGLFCVFKHEISLQVVKDNFFKLENSLCHLIGLNWYFCNVIVMKYSKLCSTAKE